MSFTTILLFFVYIWGLGFGISYFLPSSKNFLERNLMRIGIGLGTLPILIVLLNLFRIPLDWRIFLVLSLMFPLYRLYKDRNRLQNIKLKFRLTKSNLAILLVLLMFFATLFMYEKGAFAYPWLEDDDPWIHATSAKYISIEKTVFEEDPFAQIFQYVDAYPPGYSGMMGILHQTSPDLQWTLKFFNSLIISLSIIFFYFFVLYFLGSRNKALFATFVLVVVPSYLSHFIWALSLIIPLFFVVLYTMERTEEDRKWIFPGIIVYSSMLVTQPSMAAKTSVMLAIYWFVKWIVKKKFFNPSFWIIAGGLLLSMFWWIERFIAYGNLDTLFRTGLHQGGAESAKSLFEWRSVGTADRIYTFKDFFIAHKTNMINNPIGLGIFITILLLISLFFIIIFYKSLFKKENQNMFIILGWLLFTFQGIHGARLPIQFIAFRYWMIFAVSVAIFLPYGLWKLFSIAKRFGIPQIVILLIFILGMWFTSGIQKYTVNTAQWPPGIGWRSNEEIQGYMWLRTLPIDTNIYTFSANGKKVLGMGMYNCYWCEDEIEFMNGIIDETPDNIHSFLKSKQYEYIIIDTSYVLEHGANKTSDQLQSLANSGKFTPVFQNQGFFIFNIK